MLRRIAASDFAELAQLYGRSAVLHAPWMPGAPLDTRAAFDRYLERFAGPAHVGFVICLAEGGGIVGRVNVNDIVRGSRQMATVGYAGFAGLTGCGYMSEGLGLVVRYAFGELGLHRLEANIQPGNAASLRLAERVGFRREGFSPRFQFIAGAWRDHERWAITAEMVQGR
ncbi:GNAT family N-acetyltransferase [Nonomuraea sp. NBC_01738]|uniref:GNAT family N-acetyltransferase n=1 Tax=Nonomuraea sp. NBC_01738 TaxID=2976003 RepID=UPI002E13F822|nr:GNAT family N-acetyltransferase [Nonomuraea sp. NBC_01738]